MDAVVKFDWFPVYVHRAKASETWGLDDYKWCWFWKLLFNSVDSARPGYLPNDVDELWRLAGARTKEFFLKRGGLDLVGRYFRRTTDGLWIYNPRLLQVMTEQTEKKRVKQKIATPFFSITGLDVVSQFFEKAYENYPRHVGKRAAEKAFTSAIARHAKNGDAGKCAEMIAEKAALYAKTPAGKRGTYTPHMSTWLNQDRFLDDYEEWFTEPTNERKPNRAEEIQQQNRAAIRAAFDESVGVPANGQGIGEIPEPDDHEGNGAGLRRGLGKTGDSLQAGSFRAGATGICIEAGAEILPDARGTGDIVRGSAGNISTRKKVVPIAGND